MGLSLRKLGSKIFDQINPFDNGRTYQQRTPTNNRSVVQQAVNSGASNVAQGVARNAVRVAGQTPVGRVVAPVVAPISSPQDFIDNVSVPVERAVTKSPVGRGLQGVGLGALRVGAGYAQAAGGAYDLATPGLGKNRLSKSATALGKQTDDTLKEVGGNQAIYKGAQLGSEVALQYLLKGAGSLGKVGIKGLSQIPKVASGASAVSKGVKVATSPVTKAINPATAKVSQGITKVGTKGLGGKITAKAATNIVSPKYQGVNAAFSGIQLSKEAAQGRAITPERIATDLAIGGVAFPVAGAVGSQALLPGAKIALKGVGKGAKVSAKATQDAIQAVRNPLKPLNEGGYIRLSDGKDITAKKIDSPDYAMSHRPAEGVPAHDLTAKVDGEQMIPSDMYDQWYGSRGTLADKESISALKAIKGKPDADVTIYRASPNEDLNHGDWVTLSKDYAQQHAEGQGGKVHAYKVKANELKWAMDDVNEFGFFPTKTAQPTKNKLGLTKLNEGGTLGDNNQPTIKNVFGEDVPNPNYQPKASQLPKVALKQETAPQVGKTDTKRVLAEGFMDIDTRDPIAVRGVFDKAGYVDRGGYKVHPDVDPRWVDDLSPETRQLMADEGITYIDPSPDQDVFAMAVQKNLGDNKVKGISVNSKKDAGLFTNKDSIVVHEIGHHKWNQLSPAEKAEWGNRPAQSEFGKRIEAGHQHSGAMKGEEEFAEQFAAQQTGRYGGGGAPTKNKLGLKKLNETGAVGKDVTSAPMGRDGERGSYTVFRGEGDNRTYEDFATKSEAIKAHNDYIKKGEKGVRVDTYNGDGDLIDTFKEKPKIGLTKLNEGGYAKIPKTSQLPKVALKQETAPQAPVPENNLVDSLPNNNIASEQQIASALGMSDQQLKQAQLDSVPPRVEAPKLPVATRPKPTVETITSAPKEPLQYVEGQQALEKLAGNKTQEQLLADGNLTTGGSGIIPRVPTKVNKPIDVTADAVTGGTNNLLGKALRNQNPIVNMVGQIAYGLNRKSTLTNAEKSLVEQVQGRQGGIGSLSDDIQQTLEAPLKNLDEPTMAASKEKVFEAFLKHNAGDIPTSKAIIESFSPEERQYFDKVRELNKIRNELNRGQMADEVIAKGDEGMHMPRLYQFDESQGMTDDIEAYALSQNKTLDLNPAKRRKQLEDIAEELQSRMLRDPAQAAVIRTEIALHNRAIGQYSATIGKIANAVSDTNKRGYLQIPDSPKYGELSGKFVRKDLSYPILGRGDRLESQTSKAASELMDKWQAGVFGKIEDGLRQLLTVFNPATRLGNRGANIVQSQLSGFNIPEAAARQQHYMNVLKRGGDEMTRLAKTYGAIDDTDALAKFSGVQRQSKGMRGKLQKSYQNTDAGAKVAMFEWQLKKGATPQEAARFVNRALPNIGNSGEIYQFFSRLPVLGIPFRAIQPEVFRALGSAAGRHPVALISAMAAYSAFQSFTWEDVPEEERKQIEARFGAGNTPFAKLNEFTESNSLPDTGKVLPTSWSFNAGKFVGDKGNIYEVDPRRLAGIYSLNTSPGDTSGGLLDEAKKVSPAPIPFRAQDGKLTFQPQELVGSRTFSTPYQMLIDRDFRGKSIQDPEGKIYNPDGTISYKYVDKETGKPTFKKDPARLAEFLARGYVTQTGDVENIRDAKKGNKNFYGQDMTVAQAGLRLAALKGERFTPERLKEMRQNDAYYAEKKEIDDMVKDKSPATQERFKRLTGYYKLREKVANEFKPGEERDKKAPVFNFAEDKWKEYTSDPELYDLMMEKKKKENKRQGSPIPPEFDERLSSEFRKQLINNKSLAPGEDAEADGKMYAHAEWDKYEGIRKEYDDKAKKYYPQRKDGEFNDELVKHKSAEFPEKPPAKKAYDDAYALYSQGKGPKPAYNDAVDAGKTAYNQAKLDWTNAERKARGLVAISPEEWNNATFGFQSDEEKVYKELKYAKGYGKNGYGGGSGGGSSSPEVESAYKYAIKLKSSGGIPKPKVKAVASKKVKASGKVGKIKVSSKKSLV